jgi:hypothetical protein
VTAIKKNFDVLSSSNASQAQKLASLKFLGHWVGDIHQPLHVSFEDDRGGNSILVTGICGTNLHSAWDTCLVLKAVGEDVDEAATELMKTITPARIESWSQSTPMDWANESFAIAEQAQTQYCIRQGASCDQPAGKVTIDAAGGAGAGRIEIGHPEIGHLEQVEALSHVRVTENLRLG